jgi:hypothetical protein
MFVTVQYTLFKQRQGVTVMPPEVRRGTTWADSAERADLLDWHDPTLARCQVSGNGGDK